ncbi:MAG: SEC-C metal-binding domain-containing protein [Kofleriaceae bacterium]
MKERNRVIAGERISRAQIAAAGSPSLGEIEAALDAWDHERAAMLAFARKSVPIEITGKILPGIELPSIALGLIAISDGDRATLLDVIRERRFPPTKEAADLEAIVLYAAWKAGAASFNPELRRLSARQLTAEAYALLATIGASNDDEHVRAALKPIATFAKEYAKSVAADDKALSQTADQVIAALPAEVELSRGGFTVRAQKLPGRNDPCYCGSGQKFKKCCADKPVAEASPVEGLSWDEFLAGDKITVAHVQQLDVKDLLQVEFSKLAVEPVREAMHKLARANAWVQAERALDELERRGDEQLDDRRDELVQLALFGRQKQLARKHIAKLPPELHKHYELELAVEQDPASAWTRLVERTRETLATKDKVTPDVDLAYSLLRAEPALGIVFARACIGTLHVDDPDLLLEAVEDARDDLGVAPMDPAWDVLDALTVKGDRKSKKKKVDASELEVKLADATARADQAERSLAAARAELAASTVKPVAELVRTDSADGGRVAELEGVIREGQAERRELRRQLEEAMAAQKAAEPARVVDDADEGVDDLPIGQRGITLPRFDRKFTTALEEVPGPVAAEAMRTIGILCSGDGFAWKTVKQAKDMVRPLYMARVGIHHRLLFRCDEGILDAMDLITRETLLTTLKRIRALR